MYLVSILYTICLFDHSSFNCVDLVPNLSALTALLICKGGLGPPTLVKKKKKKIYIGKKIYINNYFKLICFGTNLTWKYCIYILKKNILFTKLTYFGHPNKNIEYFYLRLVRIWVQ